MNEAKLDLILEKLGLLSQDVSELKTDVSELKTDVSELKTDVSKLKTDIDLLKDRTRSLEMTLENETNRNITIIAEGHLNLDRKLDEAIKTGQDNMMYQLRVNFLDNEMRKVKQVLSMN